MVDDGYGTPKDLSDYPETTPRNASWVLAEQWVRRWFCQDNEILWERGGHYKEEVEALVMLICEAAARGLETGRAERAIPEINDFLTGVQNEAAHQRDRRRQDDV